MIKTMKHARSTVPGHMASLTELVRFSVVSVTAMVKKSSSHYRDFYAAAIVVGSLEDIGAVPEVKI